MSPWCLLAYILDMFDQFLLRDPAALGSIDGKVRVRIQLHGEGLEHRPATTTTTVKVKAFV